MRSMGWTAVVVLALARLALGQGPLPTTSGTGFTGAPYSAKETSQVEKRTTSGAIGRNTYITQLWRDAAGRTRQEHVEISPEGFEVHSVVLIDPVGGVTMKWSVGDDSKLPVVTVWPLPERQRVTGPPPGRNAAQKSAPRPGSLHSCGADCTLLYESLEPRTIDGIYAEGRRSTRTYKAGTQQNGEPLMVAAVNELWMAPELGILLRTLHDDPTTGCTRTEVTEVITGELDPALFTAPEGYQIRDMRQNGAAR